MNDDDGMGLARLFRAIGWVVWLGALVALACNREFLW